MSAAGAAGGLAFARLVSVLLHPFAVFVALALLAAWRLDRTGIAGTAVGIGLAVAVVWAFVLHRRRSGRWQTVDASRRQERPALYALVLMVALAYWWWQGAGASASGDGVLAVVGMLCVAAFANRWIKLSLHMASLAFAGVALLPLIAPAGVAALALLPLLAWSRLRLGRHRLDEVLGGSALGLVAGLLLLASR